LEIDHGPDRCVGPEIMICDIVSASHWFLSAMY